MTAGWRTGLLRLTSGILTAVTCVTVLAGASSAQTPAPASEKDEALRRAVSRRLEATAEAVDGVVAYHIVDVATGQVFSRDADAPFPTASAIKIGILYELFRQADEGRIDLDAPREVAPSERVGGSGVLQHLHNPAVSPRDHAMLMILLSDNTSTNVLIDLVGIESVNRRMASLGATTFALERRMMDADAVAAGRENLSSAADLVRVMDAIRRGDGLTTQSRDAALEILRRPGPTSIRAGVPASVPVAAKPGGLDGVRTEVAFVDLPGRPYLIAVMTTFLADEREGATAMVEMSRTAYGYFDRLARAGREGRLR